MSFKKGDIITLEGNNFIIVVTFENENEEYALVNQLTPNQEDVTQDYYIITKKNNEYQKIKDENIIKGLEPKMQEVLKLEFEREA